MAFLSSLNISGSALTAQKFRMEIASHNMANIDSVGGDTPYRRKMVVLSERTSNPRFDRELDRATRTVNRLSGVKVTAILDDTEYVKLEYDPTNPLANEDGYVEKPDINMLEEMVDMMSASRSYEANVTVFNAVKQMAAKALEIGK